MFCANATSTESGNALTKIIEQITDQLSANDDDDGGFDIRKIIQIASDIADKNKDDFISGKVKMEDITSSTQKVMKEVCANDNEVTKELGFNPINLLNTVTENGLQNESGDEFKNMSDVMNNLLSQLPTEQRESLLNQISEAENSGDVQSLINKIYVVSTNILVIENELNLIDLFKKTELKLKVINFTATWCGPCKKIKPDFIKLSKLNLDTIFIIIDIDKYEDVNYEIIKNVSSVPTYKMFIDVKTELEQLRIIGADLPTIIKNIKLGQEYVKKLSFIIKTANAETNKIYAKQ